MVMGELKEEVHQLMKAGKQRDRSTEKAGTKHSPSGHLL